MPNPITCPQCGKLVNAEERNCPNCGVDLTLAAVLATEQALNLADLASKVGQITPEILVPRLGEILLERGVLTPELLQKTLEDHRKLNSEGKPRLLGQLLLEKGLVDRETLDQVVTEQIFQLQAALQKTNQQLEQRVKERTADLQDALNKLSELNQLKSNFISNISHELRTPLTHIKGYLDLLADESLGPLTEDQSSALEVLLRAEDRLEGLIEDLIRFSLAARGEFTLRHSSVGVLSLVDGAVKRVTKLAQAKNIILEWGLPDNLPLVDVDEEKITWVFMQLLDNAIKFTPSGGRAHIDARIEENYVLVRVMDTGIGIPENRLPELFEPFHQLDGSTTRTYGGTGLGLALVRKIIEAHGSIIKVESVVGKGTCFEFPLPKAKVT